MKTPLAFMAGISLSLSSLAAADILVDVTTVSTNPDIDTEIVALDIPFGGSDVNDAFGNGPDGEFTLAGSFGNSTVDGWQYELDVDYNAYDIFRFGVNTATTDIEIQVDNLLYAGIVDAVAVDTSGEAIGTLSFTADTIQWDAGLLDVFMSDQVVAIHWNTVPAPGALMVFGLTGLVVGPRRRR